MTTEHRIIEWRADSGQWWVKTATGRQSLESWAEEQPELAQVSFTLSAANYTAHWVELPGVKGRHVARALPFALEELLIGDVADFTVIPAGNAQGRFRAYLVATELLDQLQEALELHHLRLTGLVPETAGFSGNVIVRSHDSWLVSIPGRFEGRVPEGAMNPALEYCCNQLSGQQLTIVGENLDQAGLLKTTVATGYPEAFSDIEVSSGEPARAEALVNLLHGRVQPVTEKSPAAWWRSLAMFAGFAAILMAGYLVVANYQLQSKVDQVSDASLALYKRWFPGERTSNYETHFRRKLMSGGEAQGSADFAGVMAQVSAAWAASSKDAVDVQGIRFSDRTGELLLDVTAKGQGELQAFKQGLEARGLTAEISSATADKDRIKGRVKVGGAA